MISKYDTDDICDLYGRKICDNCGKCLELDGVDIKAINIDDISKTVEENEFLENELKLALEELSLNNSSEEDADFLSFETNYDDEYVDAFENITYLDDIGLNDGSLIDEETEELYPGVLKFKNR